MLRLIQLSGNERHIIYRRHFICGLLGVLQSCVLDYLMYSLVISSSNHFIGIMIKYIVVHNSSLSQLLGFNLNLAIQFVK